MTKSMGRPPKYKFILNQLDPHTIYTPALIAQFADESRFLSDNTERKRLEKQRIRIALGRFSNNHAFPDEGDGLVTMPGQAPCPGWFGWRWVGETPE